MTELRERDLVIGNWYHSVKFNKPVILTAQDIYNLVANADGASIDSYISDMFTPIPLTEDWLKQFRAERKQSFFVVWKLRDVTFSFDKDQGRVFVEIGGRLISLNYVHQFQNYFALTGTELQASK